MKCVRKHRCLRGLCEVQATHRELVHLISPYDSPNKIEVSLTVFLIHSAAILQGTDPPLKCLKLLHGLLDINQPSINIWRDSSCASIIEVLYIATGGKCVALVNQPRKNMGKLAQEPHGL